MVERTKIFGWHPQHDSAGYSIHLTCNPKLERKKNEEEGYYNYNTNLKEKKKKGAEKAKPANCVSSACVRIQNKNETVLNQMPKTQKRRTKKTTRTKQLHESAHNIQAPRKLYFMGPGYNCIANIDKH